MNWRSLRYVMTSLAAALLSLSVTLGMCYWAYQHERKTEEIRFELAANDIRDRIIGGLIAGDEASYNIVSMFHASTAVDAEQFHVYVRDMLARHSFISSVSYMPRVNGQERAQFEQSLRAKGYARFRVKGLSGAAPLAVGDLHYPLLYLTPFRPVQLRWLGRDPLSSASFRDVMKHAVDTGLSMPAISSIGRGPLANYVLFKAIYSGKVSPQTAADRQQAVSGMIAISMKPDLLLDTSAAVSGVQLTLRWLSGETWQPLLSHDAPVKQTLNLGRMRRDYVVDLGGYSYQLRVSKALPWDIFQWFWPISLLFLGLAMSVMILMFFRAQFSRHQVIEQKVEEKTRQLHQLAYFDQLTQLPNRKMLLEKIEQIIHSVDVDDGEKVALLFVDLDRFKLVNDSLGHQMGDQLLIEAARRLGRCTRKSDLVGRLGGDEFLIVLPGLETPRTIERVCAALNRVFIKPVRLGAHSAIVTPSIGISIYPDDGEQVQALLQYADLAMYASKQAGGNRASLYSPGMGGSVAERLALHTGLGQALASGEFSLHYQPLVDGLSGSLKGAEALLRWHKEGKVISPAEFIPALEETGLICEVGRWVLLQACLDAAQLGLLCDDFKISVNVSARQMLDGDLDQDVRDALSRGGLQPSQLQLEVTESLFIQEYERVNAVIQGLHELGVTLSLDDFGTGYSSLSYLKRFPFHSLKLDRSFIRDITENREDRELVRAIIAVAQALDLNLVVEGIETEDQLSVVRGQGFTGGLVQGYLFGRPMPLTEFEQHAQTELLKLGQYSGVERKASLP